MVFTVKFVNGFATTITMFLVSGESPLSLTRCEALPKILIGFPARMIRNQFTVIITSESLSTFPHVLKFC